jgi:hypothetical protein
LQPNPNAKNSLQRADGGGNPFHRAGGRHSHGSFSIGDAASGLVAGCGGLGGLDRQRRKQAEFLIHQSCPWALIEEIGVLNTGMKARMEEIFREFDAVLHKVVKVRADWYY